MWLLINDAWYYVLQQRITSTVDSREQQYLLMDLDVSMRSGACPYTVHFYGALFRDGDVWICMEVMETSLDKFYPLVFSQGKTIPEEFLGKIAFSVSIQLLFTILLWSQLSHVLLSVSVYTIETLITSANEVGEVLFLPVCYLSVCLFVNNFLTTIVEWWNFQGLIATLRSGSDPFLKGQGQYRAKGQIHLIGYNFASNCHRDFKLGSYFSLWKGAPNVTLTLTFDLEEFAQGQNFWKI